MYRSRAYPASLRRKPPTAVPFSLRFDTAAQHISLSAARPTSAPGPERGIRSRALWRRNRKPMMVSPAHRHSLSRYYCVLGVVPGQPPLPLLISANSVRSSSSLRNSASSAPLRHPPFCLLSPLATVFPSISKSSGSFNLQIPLSATPLFSNLYKTTGVASPSSLLRHLSIRHPASPVPLFSSTYELPLQQPTCFHNHLRCRGCHRNATTSFLAPSLRSALCGTLRGLIALNGEADALESTISHFLRLPGQSD